jgi:Holliday junction resolvase RusA-like endonuclease
VYHIKFEMQGLPETTNKVRRHGHWSKTHKSRKMWKAMVPLCMLEFGHRKPRQPLTRAKLVLTRYSSVRPDFEGLVSTFKGILDGLVECGVLIDDNMGVIGQPEYHWVKAPAGKGKISIEVQEVADTVIETSNTEKGDRA